MKNKIKTTTLDYAILGILRSGPQSGYAIRKIFATSAMGNYSSSPGVIYPALKRLEKFKFVKKQVNGFQVSKKGLQYLEAWLAENLTPDDISKRMHLVLLKFAFFEETKHKETAILFLHDFIKNLKVVIKNLNHFHKQQSAHIPLFGRLALENGIENYKTHLKWAKKALKEIE